MQWATMESSTATLPTSDAPSEEIIRSVADAADVDPTELPPLYDTVDPDALDSIFSASALVSGEMTFEYVDYLVTVSADDHVVVEKNDG